MKGIAKIPGVKDITLSDGGCEDDSHLKALATSLDKGGKISLLEFLGAFCFEDNDGVTDALAEHMLAVLFRHRHVIRTASRCFDAAHSGKIIKEDFLSVLQALNAEIEGTGMHFSQSQMDDLCEALASPDGQGVLMVPYEDFFQNFIVVDSSNLAVTAEMRAEKSLSYGAENSINDRKYSVIAASETLHSPSTSPNAASGKNIGDLNA